LERQAGILVGVDFGDASAEAVRQTDEWARLHEWRPIACHVALPSEDPRDVEREIRAHWERATRREAGGVRIRIERGDAGRALVRAADEEAVRMVVVGSREHSALERALIGDIAEKVVRHARCAVLVARPHRRTGRVLAGTDLSREALAAVALAADHARRAGASLTVACSIEREMESMRDLTNFGASNEFLDAEYEELRRAAERQLDEQLRAVQGRGETLILDGPPAQTIVRAVSERDSDLLVVAAARASGVDRLPLGRVANALLRSAPCPIVIARQRD